jgi:amidohydrolase
MTPAAAVLDHFTAADPAALMDRARSFEPRLRDLRRRFHRDPEFGLETPRTQERIVQELARIGVDDVALGTRCRSVVAQIHGCGGQGPGRRIALLRADVDALPITEASGAEWASANPGLMHACGHDAHTAMLLGAAELLHGLRHRFGGTVRLWFQPGEEGFAGARVMIEEGALAGVAGAFAIHVQPSAEPHVVCLRGGPMMAAADTFGVVFRGAGGHASTPHLTRDPIPAIGPFVDGLSHGVARESDPDQRIVLSVTQVNAGQSMGAIPASACCLGTLRAVTEPARRQAHRLLRRVAEGVAASRGLEVDVEIYAGYPPTLNDPRVVGLARDVAARLGLTVRELPDPSMASEDFSYVLQQVPGAIVFLGCAVPCGGPLHADTMALDESVLPTGAALGAAMALGLLSMPPAGAST